MRRAGLVGALLLTLAISSQAVAAPPANDNFASAEVLFPYNTRADAAGTTLEATREADEPVHALNGGGASVWHTWRAPYGGTAYAETCWSEFDTLLGVYSGTSLGGLTLLAENDDNQGGCGVDRQTQSMTAPFGVTGGTTYKIAVDGYANYDGNTNTAGPPATGDYSLTIDYSDVEKLNPTTAITGLTVRSSRRRAIVRFTGNDPAPASYPLMFFCRLDGASYFSRCGSPKTYRRLKSGRHTVRVYAMDQAADYNNTYNYRYVSNLDRSPAVRRFTIR